METLGERFVQDLEQWMRLVEFVVGAWEESIMKNLRMLSIPCHLWWTKRFQFLDGENLVTPPPKLYAGI